MQFADFAEVVGESVIFGKQLGEQMEEKGSDKRAEDEVLRL